MGGRRGHCCLWSGQQSQMIREGTHGVARTLQGVRRSGASKLQGCCSSPLCLCPFPFMDIRSPTGRLSLRAAISLAPQVITAHSRARPRGLEHGGQHRLRVWGFLYLAATGLEVVTSCHSLKWLPGQGPGRTWVCSSLPNIDLCSTAHRFWVPPRSPPVGQRHRAQHFLSSEQQADTVLVKCGQSSGLL